MHSDFWQPVKVLTAAVLAFAVPQAVLSQTSEHVVNPQDLQHAAQDATHVRQQNIDTLQSLLRREDVQKALEARHIDPQQVRTAIAALNDQELAQLAARANRAQSDFAAGSMSNQDMLILIIAILALILIIVAVK